MSLIKLVCVILLISLSDAASISEDRKAKILSDEKENDGQGNYEFSFETANGIKRNESGKLVNIGEPNEHLQVQGAYSYTDPEGKLVVVNYIADENGYRLTLPTTLVKGTGLFFAACIMFTAIVMVPQTCSLEEQIKKIAFNTNGFGSYSFEYETTGGTYRREDGGIISSPSGDSLVVRGEYGYIDTGGHLFSMRYVADSNGYHVVTDDDDTRYNDRRII